MEQQEEGDGWEKGWAGAGAGRQKKTGGPPPADPLWGGVIEQGGFCTWP